MLLKHQLKNWCFWTVVVEKTLESPLDCKEIQPVHSKGNQSWVFIGRNDAEAETPILWPPDAKSWLIGKDPDAGKRLKVGGEGDDRGWDRWMASPTHWAWVWVDGELACYSPWDRKELDATVRLNWTDQDKLLECLKKWLISLFPLGYTPWGSWGSWGWVLCAPNQGNQPNSGKQRNTALEG